MADSMDSLTIDLTVTGHDRKWKAGKGHTYKVVLTNEKGLKTKLEIQADNSAIFERFPKDATFTVKVVRGEQKSLVAEDDEEE